MTDPDVIDVTAEEVTAEPEISVPSTDAAGGNEPSSEMVRVSPTQGDVMRPLDADALVSSFEEYQALRGRLLTTSDYQEAGRGRSFVKKSGWRKIATAFGLNLELVRNIVERDEEGTVVRAEVWARAIAPNGRFADGDGYCEATEERFKEWAGRKKLENDLRGTAATRAMNRAISNLVGMGEVSAEEAEGTATEPQNPHGMKSSDEHRAQSIQSVEYLALVAEIDLDAQQFLNNLIAQLGGEYLPSSAAAALIVLALTTKQKKEAAPSSA